MNDVVSGAPNRQAVLVTGFGPFPGAPKNPTAAIVAQLGKMRGAFGRLEIDLVTAVLPVVYAEMDAAFDSAMNGEKFDAILHLGVATRRATICVETCAQNAVSRRSPDASGVIPSSNTLVRGGPRTLAATYAARDIVAALRERRQLARLSRDAGTYLCNARLYRSLHTQAAPQVGFIHVPPPVDADTAVGRGRLSLADLTDAVVTAILVMTRQPPTALPPFVPTERTTDGAPAGP